MDERTIALVEAAWTAVREAEKRGGGMSEPAVRLKAALLAIELPLPTDEELADVCYERDGMTPEESRRALFAHGLRFAAAHYERGVEALMALAKQMDG